MKKLIFILSLLITLSQSSHAEISLSRTRIVFSGGQQQSSISIYNESEVDSLFQVWLDKDEDPYASVPFAALPTFSKLGPKSYQIVRVLAQGTDLPSDRESLYWFNVQEIPKVSKEFSLGQVSGLSFSIRQRLKLIYRPSSIKTEPIEMTEQLKFYIDTNKNQLVINNSSAHYITLVNFVKETNQDIPMIDGSIMVSPLSEFVAPLTQTVHGDETIYFESISDYGKVIPFKLSLNMDRVALPVRNNVKIN